MNSWTQKTFTEAIQGSSKPSCWNRRKKKKNRLHFISLRTSKLQIFSSRLLHLNDLQGISNRRWKRKFKSGNFLSCNQKRKKRRKIVNSQLGAYHQKNGSAWKSTSDEEWVFFNDFCFKGTPRLLKSSRMVSSMKKFVKSSQRTNESSTFSVSMSPATFWNLTSKTWRISSPDTSIAKRRDFPGSLDNSSILN